MPVIQATDLTRTFNVFKKDATKGIRNYLKKSYREVTAVSNINLEIEQGELVGFIGPNGAGKTTTLKMLSGLLYPSSGNADVLGYQPFKRNHEFLKQISLVMGNRNQLWSDLPAIKTFELNKVIYEVSQKDYDNIASELITILDIEDIIYQQVRKMSLGQRMKCELVASLLHKPKVLFLDEPTLGLDVVMQKNIQDFIKDYNKKYNSTVMLTSHYMDDVKEICNRIIIINKGKIIFDDSLSVLEKSFSENKVLKVILNKQIDTNGLSSLGNVEKYDFPELILNVKKENVPDVAKKLLSEYDIDDLDINEPRLEDIIRDIFQKES